MSGDPGERPGPLPGQARFAIEIGPAVRDVLAECHRRGLPLVEDRQAGELARAAVAHVIAALDCAPWAIEFWWPKGWAPLRRSGRRQELVAAAALIIGEIERCDRTGNHRREA